MDQRDQGSRKNSMEEERSSRKDSVYFPDGWDDDATQKQRAESWLEVSGAGRALEAEPSYYAALATHLIHKSNPWKKGTLQDLDRTRNHPLFALEPRERQSLENVLLVLSLRYQSRMRYTGSADLKSLAAMFLLCLGCNEEHTFWLLDVVVVRYFPDYCLANVPGLEKDCVVLAALMQRYLPGVYQHFERMQVPYHVLGMSWLLGMFVRSMSSIEHSIQVWDKLFAEGPGVLLLVSLALLRRFETDITDFQDHGELVVFLVEAPKRVDDVPELLREWAASFPGCKASQINHFRSKAFAASPSTSIPTSSSSTSIPTLSSSSAVSLYRSQSFRDGGLSSSRDGGLSSSLGGGPNTRNSGLDHTPRCSSGRSQSGMIVIDYESGFEGRLRRSVSDAWEQRKQKIAESSPPPSELASALGGGRLCKALPRERGVQPIAAIAATRTHAGAPPKIRSKSAKRSVGAGHRKQHSVPLFGPIGQLFHRPSQTPESFRHELLRGETKRNRLGTQTADELWISVIRESIEPTDSAISTPLHHPLIQKLKDKSLLIRLVGMPQTQRPLFWGLLSGALHDMRSSTKYYQQCVQQLVEQTKWTKIIEKDVLRTMGTISWFASGDGGQALKRVLGVFSSRHPHIGYCQSMSDLAAGLLLVYIEQEEAAFWTLERLLIYWLPVDYYTPDMTGARADCEVLGTFVVKLLPQLSAHLTKHGLQLDLVTLPWFMLMFLHVFPDLEMTMRVWDVFWVEGSICLIRVALALLSLAEEVLEAITDRADLFIAVQDVGKKVTDIGLLLEITETFSEDVNEKQVAKYRTAATTMLKQQLVLNVAAQHTR